MAAIQQYRMRIDRFVNGCDISHYGLSHYDLDSPCGLANRGCRVPSIAFTEALQKESAQGADASVVTTP
jgi:hypothetical protein